MSFFFFLPLNLFSALDLLQHGYYLVLQLALWVILFLRRCYFSLLAFALRTHKPVYKSPILDSLPFWECITQSLPPQGELCPGFLHLLTSQLLLIQLQSDF